MVKQIESIFSCKKDKINLGSIPICTYSKSIDDEIKAGLTRSQALDLLEDMHTIRALEDMLEQIKLGLYKPLPKFNYVGPTHLSIGQEATAAGAISAIGVNDYITSSHRGHGDAMAKGCSMIKLMDENRIEEEIKEMIKKKGSSVDANL